MYSLCMFTVGLCGRFMVRTIIRHPSKEASPQRPIDSSQKQSYGIYTHEDIIDDQSWPSKSLLQNLSRSSVPNFNNEKNGRSAVFLTQLRGIVWACRKTSNASRRQNKVVRQCYVIH